MRRWISSTIIGLAVLGCATGTDEPWDGFIDTGIPDTVPDVFDTFPDTGPDTGFDTFPDTPVDTFFDPDVDPDRDPDPDPDPDPEPEAPCISGTGSSGGTCNIIDRCGCTSPQWCYWEFDDVACTIIESCISITAGTLPHGSACNPASTTAQCVPGADCLSTDGVTGTCQAWCESDLDCPSGYTCSVPVNVSLGSPCGDLPMPYDACSI